MQLRKRHTYTVLKSHKRAIAEIKSAQQRVEKATEERDKLKRKLKKAQARLAAGKQCVSSASAVVRQDCAKPLTSALPELRLPGAGHNGGDGDPCASGGHFVRALLLRI